MQRVFRKGPVTLLRSVCQRMKNITHTLTYARGTLGIGCIRFKHGGIRRGRNFFKHA